MARYKPPTDTQAAYCKKAKPYRAPALSVFRTHVGNATTTGLYDELHRAWRAGVIADFYFGRRSPADPTVVWEIDGIEIDPATIPSHLAARMADTGVQSVVWGSWWCGYRSVVVTFTGGLVVTQEYDGNAVVERTNERGAA